MISLTQYSFTIAQFAFTVNGIKSLAISFFDFKEGDMALGVIHTHNVWTYGTFLIIVCTLLAWVRNISKFSFTFLFATILMLITGIVIAFYALDKMAMEGIGKGVFTYNTDTMVSMIGFSIYTFEGIGILMPVMQTCECPEKYEEIYTAAIVTLCGIHIVFGNLCYIAFGKMKT